MPTHEVPNSLQKSQGSPVARRKKNSEDSEHVREAEGWLELGSAAEALEELEQISGDAASRLDVLRARYTALASAQQWRFAFFVSEVALRIFPGEAEPWLWRAHALRAVTGSAAKARDFLVGAGTRFPADPIILLNLALYESELDRPAEAAEWLSKSRRAAEASNRIGTVRALAQQDQRLRDLWVTIDRG